MDIKFKLLYGEVLVDVNYALLAFGFLTEYGDVAIRAGRRVLLAVGTHHLLQVAQFCRLIDVYELESAPLELFRKSHKRILSL